jgi:hypothetical protein
MLRTLLTVLLLTLLAAPCFAKGKEVERGPQLKFGMAQDAAERVISDKDLWAVAYRIDTASTAEIAAVWKGTVFYIAKFYNGRCYSIEKRAEVTKEEVEKIIRLYTESYGTTPEATEDREGRMLYARWTRPDKEISLNAIRGRGGLYKLIHEERDTMVYAEARVAQEREMLQQPTEEDPLTGKRRIKRAAEPEQTSAADFAADADGGAAEDTDEPADDAADADDASSEADAETESDDEAEQPEKRPRINDDDPEEW